MRIENHLLNDIKPLKPEDVVGEVLDVMEELKYSHLPVVDEERLFLGLVCEDDLLEFEEDSKLSRHQHILKPFSIALSSHVFEALRIFGEGNLSLLPVVDATNKYCGYMSATELLQDIGRQLSFVEAGSAIVLKMAVRDYHLAQVAQIVESEDAKVMGLFLVNDEEADALNLVIKINQQDISRIVQSFQRYNYNIVAVFHQSIFDENMEDRFESFMKYINI